MFKEFKEFVIRGNVLDLAVGIIIGVAFGKVITSLVNDILMPPIGAVVGKVDFANLFIDLSGVYHPTVVAAKAAGAATINYGLFLTAVIDFLLVALAIFMVVRVANRLRRQPAPPPPSTKDCQFCFTAIPIKALRCPNCTSQVA